MLVGGFDGCGLRCVLFDWGAVFGCYLPDVFGFGFLVLGLLGFGCGFETWCGFGVVLQGRISVYFAFSRSDCDG